MEQKSTTTIVQFDLNNQTMEECSPNNFQPNFAKFIYWIHLDLNDETTPNQLAKLNLTYDSLNIQPQEKKEFFPYFNETGENLSFQMRCPTTETLGRANDIQYSTVSVFLTANYCLTVSKGMPAGIELFKKEYLKAIRYAETPCFILFLLLDNMTNEYLELLLEFESLSDAVELDFRHITTTTYQKVFQIKRRVIRARQYVAILVDILMRLSGRKLQVISENCRSSLIDLLTHCQMVVTQADSIREAINSTLDAINNALMGRLNETIKILTVYTMFFMPPALITGIYGMNFKNMPELSWKYGYPMVIGLMVVFALLMFYSFKKRKWL